MKNIYIKTVFLVCFLTVLSSCEDFVDIEPKGQVFATSVEQLQQLFYDSNNISTNRAYEIHAGSDDFRDFDSETLPFNNPYPGGIGPMLAFRDFLYAADANSFYSSYNDLYTGINLANIVLESIDGVDGSLQDKNKLEGRALVFRANLLLELVNCYAKHYSEDYANEENSGIIIPVNSRSDYALKRNTIQEVYDYIITDLEMATALLTDATPEYLDQPNLIAAYGYLARTYLYMGNWKLAEEYADNALTLKSDLYDYKTDVAANEFPHGSSLVKDIENIIVSYNSTINFSGGFNYLPAVSVNPELLNLYEDNDLRRTIFYADNLYRGKYGEVATVNRTNSGITVPELILTRAEANARMGNGQLALDDLNVLRTSRFEAGYTPLTDVSKALELVKLERRLELVFNFWRLIDIKRYNLIDNDNITVTHINTTTNTTHTLSPGDNNWVLPIPAFIVSTDPTITQNPRDGN